MSNFNTYDNMLRITTALQQPTPTTPVGFDRVTEVAIAQIQGYVTRGQIIDELSDQLEKARAEREEQAGLVGKLASAFKLGPEVFTGEIVERATVAQGALEAVQRLGQQLGKHFNTTEQIAAEAIAKILGCAALNAELAKRSEIIDRLTKERVEIANALGVDAELHAGSLAPQVCDALRMNKHLNTEIDKIISALGGSPDEIGLGEIPNRIGHLRVQLEDTQRAHAKVADELHTLQNTLENSGVSAAEDLARIQKLEQQVDTLIRLLDMAVMSSAPIGNCRIVSYRKS